ncbi:MAG: metallophosphoesterase [Ruminococcaceae bacterium]|nr:metallophosphoesterase [Oscillospiraceae bacterium]
MEANLFLHQTLSKIITLAFAGLFSVYSFFSGVKEVKTEKPDNFEPVLRFVVCSDIHLGEDENGKKNAEKLRKLFDKAYEIAEKSEVYTELDAILVAGDFTEQGKIEEYEIYKEITEEKLKNGTQLLTCLGNHEQIAYRDTANPEKATEVFQEYIGTEADTHNVINGYHFIGVSYDDTGEEAFKTKTEWLRTELDKAVAETGEKPVFVYQHPHPALSVYGSVNWANMDIRMVLKDYPQVVDFSGHSHYAANDPRSIHQSTFTAIGCGAVTGAMGNLSYISGDAYGDGESGTFWICEVDDGGNVRLRLYDVISDCFYENIDYYLTDLADKSRRAYTWGRMMAQDTPPVFPDSAELTVSNDEEGNTLVTFPEAQGYYRAENYKITLSRNGEKIKDLIVLSDYTRATDFEKTVNLGVLENGEYEIKVRAYSPYAKKGDTKVWEFGKGETPLVDSTVTGGNAE